MLDEMPLKRSLELRAVIPSASSHHRSDYSQRLWHRDWADQQQTEEQGGGGPTDLTACVLEV